MAVLGPLSIRHEPHSYDLCERHAVRLTAPKGWEVVRHEGEFTLPAPTTDDLEALANAVREAARSEPRTEPAGGPGRGRRGHLRALPTPD